MPVRTQKRGKKTMKKKIKKEVQEKRRKEDLNSISKNLNNMATVIETLLKEYKSIKMIHERILREEQDKNPYDWKKDKSLSVNKWII